MLRDEIEQRLYELLITNPDSEEIPKLKALRERLRPKPKHVVDNSKEYSGAIDSQ